MTNEMNISQWMSQHFIPVVFIAAIMILFVVCMGLLYNFLLIRWIPMMLMYLFMVAGLAYIVWTCVEHYEDIRDLVSGWSLKATVIGVIVFLAFLGAIAKEAPEKKKRNKKNTKRKSGQSAISQRSRRVHNRSDEDILTSSLDHLSGADFERLLALYFRDQGYEVHEVGVGGSDGGVDLVIIDQRGEKTAVQAKCYADHNLVGVSVVRELVGAKRNHDCILTLLVTTSDLTGPAKIEAEKFKVDYWHGGVVEQKLKTWGKWKPSNRRSRSPRSEKPKYLETDKVKATASGEIVCSCGALMILRKGRDGKSFYGCSSFPRCRHTRSV